jgi:hypothetical protein
VVNAGVSGYSTHEERRSYERFSSAYQPQLVLVLMVFNDDLSYGQEMTAGEAPTFAGIDGSASPLAGLWEKQEKHGRAYDYASCARELLQLDDSCRKQGAKLAVAFFRPADIDPWPHFIEVVSEGLRGTDIPIVDLGPALLEEHIPEELVVHPIDGHPNEIAHRLAAEEIERFLRARKLLPP